MKTAWKELLYAVNGAFLFLLIVLATEIALGQTTEVPENARVLSVRTEGPGCETTQSAVNFSPDLLAMSVLFSNFNMELGAGTANPLEEKLDKNCDIRVEIQTPPGWSLAISSVDYRGFALLPEGAMAKHQFSYRTDGMPEAHLREAPLQGPLNQDYFFSLEQPLSERRHTPCSPPNIRLRLKSKMVLKYPVHNERKTGPRETAILSLDSADVSLQQDFHLEWKRCGGRKNAMR